MKSLIIISAVCALILPGCQKSETVMVLEKGIVQNAIRWYGDNETANYLAREGLRRYITYENNHAFILSEAAVEVDATLFASHVILSFLSEGERKVHHKRMANLYVDDENEVNTLFVSLLDFNNENDSSGSRRREIWSKMHELSNSPFIHYMYIRYMEGGNTAKIEELDKLIAFCEAHHFTYTGTAANNYKGYLLMSEDKLEAGTAAIDNCVALHPEGYNPYDSRAEFFLYTGDTINSIKWYKKVLEQYPYAGNARSQLEKLDRRQ